MTDPRLHGLTLTVTERCNLRCGYCYVPVERGRTMSPETADAAVDLLLRRAAPGATLDLSFFGGEPFLAPSLLQRAIDRTRAGAGRGRKVRVATPTNGTLLEGERLEFCRANGIELALSLDGDEASSDRPFAGGGDSTAKLLPLLPGILSLDPGARITARMTVTPANVGALSTNVRTLARLGFRRIVFLPAFELAWDEPAVAAWRREHERIGTWLVGVHGAGKRPPDLPTWRGVEERLVLGRPRRACGAGARLAAVATDGAIYPCYRFVFAAGREEFRLGSATEGFTNREALALFAALDPSHARPEEGDCATCEARDGCTFVCPALGFWMLRDPLAIPASACRLTRAAVAAIRPYAAVQARPSVKRRSGSRWAAAAIVATAVTGAAATAACGSSGDDDNASDVTDATAEEGTGDGTQDDTIGPGLCPVGADADADADDVPEIGPGVCPVGADADADADADLDVEEVAPGLCPVSADADADADEGAPEIGPGLCPVFADADADPVDDSGGPGPGLCPVPGIC